MGCRLSKVIILITIKIIGTLAIRRMEVIRGSGTPPHPEAGAAFSVCIIKSSVFHEHNKEARGWADCSSAAC